MNRNLNILREKFGGLQTVVLMKNKCVLLTFYPSHPLKQSKINLEQKPRLKLSLYSPCKDKVCVLRVVHEGSWHHVVEYNVGALLGDDINVRYAIYATRHSTTNTGETKV